MDCTECGKPIKLIPSAAERARKDVTGNTTAAFYTRLFTVHPDCAIKARNRQTSELIAKYYR